jgi:hypothetical protein
MKFKSIMLILLALFVIQGCGKDEKNEINETNKTSEASEPSQKSNQSSIEKFNQYVDAYNDINKWFWPFDKGPDNSLKEYKDQDFNNGANISNPSIFLSTDAMTRAIENIKKAQATETSDGKFAQIDEVGKKFLAIAEPLLKQATEIKPYFDSKKYIDDNFAFIKGQNKEFIDKWSQFNVVYHELGSAISALERQNRLDEIKYHKDEGNYRAASLKQSLLIANDLITAISESKDPKTDTKVATLIADLDKELANLKKEIDSNNDDKKSSYTTELDQLNRILGSARSIKANPNDNDYDSMIREYNNMIDFLHMFKY